jgi:hypothetical protein
MGARAFGDVMRGGIAAGLMALGSALSAPAAAELPARSTQGIAQVAVLCLLVDDTADRLRLQRRMCDQARALAAEGAPVPVAAIGFGDPVLLRADVLGVLVHVAIDRSGPRPLAIVLIRPHRAAGQGALFGASPVAVPLESDGAIPEPALAAALDQVLPWRIQARH